MARPYLPSFFGRGDDPFGSLFREVQKTFEDFSQRGPFAQFRSDMTSPKVDIAESKDAIDVTAELPGVDEKKSRCNARQRDVDRPRREKDRARRISSSIALRPSWPSNSCRTFRQLGELS